MKRISHWIPLVLALFFIIIITLFLTYHLRYKNTIQGTLPLPYLKSKVQVLRDRWGIPHIYADHQVDLFRALGFVTASDRLFQMDLNRRLGNGELSEIFGEKLLPIDKLFRNFRFRSSMAQLLEKKRSQMSPEFFELAEAYLNGVNYYVETQKLPMEFDVLQYKPRKFELLDIFAFSGYMSYSFAEALTTDLLYGELKKKLREVQWKELKLSAATLSSSSHSRPKLNSPKSKIPAEQIQKTNDILFSVLGQSLQMFASFDGSNSWVLAPKKSASGQSLLANDPHISFSNPGVWYEAHLHSPQMEIYGHFLPLIPFAVLGHNRQMGWTITMSEVDDLDFYKETFHPTNPNLVKYRNQWVPITKYQEKIQVKGLGEVPYSVKVTPHGPLLEEFPDILKGKPHQSLSLKWAFHHPDNLLLESIYRLPYSQKLKDFSTALRLTKAPGLNISYADRQGNIAWWVIGAIPQRPSHVESNTVLEGANGKDEYLGYRDFSDNPHSINPPSGMIVTANYHPQTSKKKDATLQGYWRPAERYNYLEEQLKKKEKWSIEELKGLQTSQYEISYQEVLPILLQEVENLGLADAPQSRPSAHLEKKALQILKTWTGESPAESVAATLYHFWNEEVLHIILDDKLSEKEIPLYCSVSHMWPFYKKVLQSPSSHWWDNGKTPEVQETRRQVIQQAFQQTIEALGQKLGKRIEDWTWGKMHTLEFIHPLGRKWPLNYLFNEGPHPVGGGYLQVNCMQPHRCKRDFKVVSGPSTRRLVDFADPETSWGILPLGESGNRASPHLTDQLPLFLKGEYRQQIMKKEDIEGEKTSEMLFIPTISPVF